MHQNLPFELKNRKKIFWEGAQPPPQTTSRWGGGRALPTLHPLGASILAPTALHSTSAFGFGVYGARPHDEGEEVGRGAMAMGLMGS